MKIMKGSDKEEVNQVRTVTFKAPQSEALPSAPLVSGTQTSSLSMILGSVHISLWLFPHADLSLRFPSRDN